MLKYIFIFLVLINNSYAKSWGIWINKPESEYKLKVGGRLQGSLLHSDANEGVQDFYVRRARLNVDYRPKAKQQIILDVRNDKVNHADSGEGSFTLGDFYWRYKLSENNQIRLFRSKVDVSYSQTSSSKHLVHIERAAVAEYAASFINESRRASNAQLLGSYHNFSYQLLIGDGVQSGDLEDLYGNSVSAIVNQRLMYGGKFRYYFFDDTQHKIQESFYGKGKSLSIGLGYFQQDQLKLDLGSSQVTPQKTLVRKLTNVELRAVLGRFNFLAEYFRFDGDIIDVDDALFDSSAGGYVLAEYYFTKDLKHSIYFRTEQHNRYLSSDEDMKVAATGIGYNHYIDEEALRWGAYVQSSPKNDALLLEQENSLNVYVAMNY